MTRRGMTLVEMLVATTATLILMGAIAQIFGVFGNIVSGSRATLALDAQMRTVAWRLRSDLTGTTARTLPPLGPSSGEGYFEVIEGLATDSTPAAAVSGDHDDALLFTTRSVDAPFIGRAPGSGSAIANMFESTLAEVAWFARPDPAGVPQTYTLYRRQLLVMGYVGRMPFHTAPGGNNSLPWSALTPSPSWGNYYEWPCDVSVRLENPTAGAHLFPNTLADLTRREARFMHNPTGLAGPNTLATAPGAFPFLFAGGNHQVTPPPDGLIFSPTGPRAGEDVVLTNVLSFDVRVFDPTAPVDSSGNTALVPGDPGFTVGSGATGAYVDLGINTAVTASRFSVAAQTVTTSGVSPGNPPILPRTYDTWSLHYEANGLNEDNVDGVDQSMNGLDDNGDGVIDDPAEFETRPPYPYPLRGIEVRIRCYEPSSRQVRQVTIRHTFVPH